MKIKEFTQLEILEGNKLLTEMLGWKLEEFTYEGKPEGTSKLYVYNRYNKNNDIIDSSDKYDLYIKPNIYLRFFSDWNFLMQAVEEIQTSKINEYASIDENDSDYGYYVRYNLFGHESGKNYWLTYDKTPPDGLIFSSKREAMFDAVIQIFNFYQRFI